MKFNTKLNNSNYFYSKLFSDYLEKKILKKLPFSKTDSLLSSNLTNNTGLVISISDGVVFALGLGSVKLGEMVQFGTGKTASVGLVLNLEFKPLVGVVAGIVSFSKGTHIIEGTEVYRTHKLLSIETSWDLLGSTIDPIGNFLAKSCLKKLNSFENTHTNFNFISNKNLISKFFSIFIKLK